jgi:tripartite-type tricarboxylate transporter receptor subunit TctC
MKKLTWLLLLLAGTAFAQPYPNKTIRVAVAFPPGGPVDIIARLIGPKLSDSLGQSVVVENVVGAGGNMAATRVAKAPADGYTVLISTNTTHAANEHLYKKLPYDPVKDFAPVSRIATASNVLVVNTSLPATSIAELVQLAKSKPGVLNYASAGIGSPAHLAGEMLNLLAGIKLTHVPYKGAAPGLLDVIAGNAQLIITSPISAGAHMNGGRVRALATTGAERNPRLPELPTIADTVPGYEISQSWGIVVPAGTPAPVVARLSDEIVRAMNLPDVKERVLNTGAVPAGDTPAAFAAFMARERQRLGEVIAKTGIVLAD